MDFALMPPEVNSTLMYSGPGSGPMLTAAAAWESLARELHSTAASYRSLLSGVTAGPWLGPASAAMSTAVAPHVTWLSTTAAQVEQAGAQAAASAGAFEAAFAATVPPAEVAANRALLASLVATNIFGQNTPAIAVVEADYAEMWAQDAGAMYSYAGASAAATALPEFVPPQTTTTPSGLAAQAAAVGQAVGGSAAGDAMALQQFINNLPSSLQGMAGFTNAPAWLTNPAAALGLTGHTWTPNGDGIVVGGLLGDVVEGLTGSATIDGSTGFDAFIRLVSPVRLFATAFRDIHGLGTSLLPHAASEGAKALQALPAAIPAPSALPGLGGIGSAAQIGGLSVPNAWASATPGLGRVSTLPFSGAGANAAVVPEPSQHMLGGMPLAGGLGRGAAANAPRYGFHPTVMTRPPFAG
ncbi:PPE family protein [Mycobacterium sp. Z3061]|uniref:PPE family protein n=1 Tax=Mycobacterium sp. Z3061 TaxID=3073562 RepID=UPI0028732E0F|nr:PPE family protein [Mycobacterium sp. Z3061]